MAGIGEPMLKLSTLLAAVPIVGSLRGYNRESMVSDLIAGLVVSMMLIPQSLAYALLAGVPPEVGLYASILPLVAYAIFDFISSIRYAGTNSRVYGRGEEMD